MLMGRGRGGGRCVVTEFIIYNREVGSLRFCHTHNAICGRGGSKTDNFSLGTVAKSHCTNPCRDGQAELDWKSSASSRNAECDRTRNIISIDSVSITTQISQRQHQSGFYGPSQAVSRFLNSGTVGHHVNMCGVTSCYAGM